ncbi:cycloartenol synthase [Quercus suber]|uniref:Cycloartenol synthase n=1 Tax=Quercus suber TaxID=58331 RepID=A0AAW0M1L0_QUESU
MNSVLFFVLGVYEWSGNNPLPPEIWLFPYLLPCHPGRMWCHCRMVYLPMSYLYGKRFVGPITSTIRSLTKELYTVPYHEIDWNEARNLCAKEDHTTPIHYFRISSGDLYTMPMNLFLCVGLQKIEGEGYTNCNAVYPL